MLSLWRIWYLVFIVFSSSSSSCDGFQEPQAQQPHTRDIGSDTLRLNFAKYSEAAAFRKGLFQDKDGTSAFLRARELEIIEYSAPGSKPPKCDSKCGKCTPCTPVRVPVQPGPHKASEYYPEAWRCKCKGKLYMP